ncbi:hypothetical protein FACS189450_14900 [Spirochaetia bacterium]|nr:hypothetical protein FACS189450_14900 [Spirochaetia bacterium]
MDISGVTVIPFEYLFFDTNVSDDAICFGILEEDTRRARWGFINLSNRVIIPPLFYGVGRFYKGIAPVSKDGEKFGIIDKEGKYILDEQYESIQSFQSDRAVFKQNGLFGFLDTTGKVVIAAQFSSAKSFDGELALISKNGIEGYVTKNGVIYLSSSY